MHFQQFIFFGRNFITNSYWSNLCKAPPPASPKRSVGGGFCIQATTEIISWENLTKDQGINFSFVDYFIISHYLQSWFCFGIVSREVSWCWSPLGLLTWSLHCKFLFFFTFAMTCALSRGAHKFGAFIDDIKLRHAYLKSNTCTLIQIYQTKFDQLQWLYTTKCFFAGV